MTTKNMFKFNIIAKDKKSRARVVRIVTPHGTIDTPAFVAVGTRASVKGLTPQDLKEIGVQIFFGNTYHLHLRPGEDVVEEFGGLAKFMGWNGPTMTDSGGFQVFSLGREKSRKRDAKDAKNERIEHEIEPRSVKITDDGVLFRSHLDGSLHNFTPEKSIEIQKKLGADIILAFDECVPYPSSYEYTKQAMERTHKWASRSLTAHKSEIRNPKSETISNVQNLKYKNDSNFRNSSEVTVPAPRRWPNGLLRGGRKQALYGIIQGGVYKDLRVESAKFISSLPFDGIAIGGVSVGESKKEMRDALDWVAPFLPDNKPLHLLGIGEIDDIFAAVERGMDTFDCVIPTRFGRYGIVFVSPPEGNIKNRFRIDINKSKFAKDKGSLSKNCKCYVCQKPAPHRSDAGFTRGYINHLFRVQELLAYRLASYHNLYFINNLVKQIREAIWEGRFGMFKKEWF